MSKDFQDLSPSSLIKIILSLKGDIETLDSLRSTNKRINTLAYSQGLHEAEEVYLTLFSMFSDPTLTRPFIENNRKCYTVTAILSLKRPCDSSCRKSTAPNAVITGYRTREIGQPSRVPRELREIDYRDDLLPLRNTLRDSYVTRNRGVDAIQKYIGQRCENGFRQTRLAKKTQTLFNEPSNECFIRMLEEALKRVHSVKELDLSGWNIDGTLIEHLTNHPKLRMMNNIRFTNCVMNMSKTSFLTFLRSAPINKINLNCRFKQFCIDDSCLVNMDNIDLKGQHEAFTNLYNKVTDNIIKKWIEKPVQVIKFFGLFTSISLSGVIQLLEASLAVNSTSIYNLGVFYITKKEYLKFLSAVQKNREINWSLEKIDGDNVFTASLLTNKKFHLSFWIKRRLRKEK